MQDLVEVEGGKLWIIILDEADGGLVVGTQLYFSGTAIVEMGESDLVLRSYLVSDDYLVDVVELIPVFVLVVQIPVQRLKLGSTGNRHVECLRSEEAPLVEQVEVVFVDQVT